MELERNSPRESAGAPLWAFPLAALMALSLLAGCQRHSIGNTSSQPGSGDSAQTAGSQSQAERTREVEEKARQINERAVEIQNMQGTEQEKIDAVNKLEQDRQDLNKTAGDGSAPPPPQ